MTPRRMHWRDYEAAIYRVILNRFPQAQVKPDQMLPGRFSGIDRQIDVLAKAALMDFETVAVVDCKCYSDNVDVKAVEMVIGLVADVGADIGLIVTTKGYSEAALARAKNEPNVRTHLDIVTVNDLDLGGPSFPVYAFMHYGQTAVAVVSPSGWFVTSNAAPGGYRRYDIDALAIYHDPDHTFEQAYRSRSIGWSHIIADELDEGDVLENYIKFQHDNTMADFPGATILYWEEGIENQVLGRDPWSFRKIVYDHDDYIDITCFKEIAPGYVFYTILMTDAAGSEHDLDRLRQVAANCIPLYAPEVNPRTSHVHWSRVLDESGGFYPDGDDQQADEVGPPAIG